MKNIIWHKLNKFIYESNAIEGVFDQDSFDQAKFAWEYLVEHDEMNPGVILHAHKILMLHQKLYPNEKGYFRTCEVTIGGDYGLPWSQIPYAIGTWCEIVNGLTDPRKIKQCHIEFEKIHPFIDGNGRIGRLLLNWQRHKLGLPILVIYNKNKQAYYKWFKEVSCEK